MTRHDMVVRGADHVVVSRQTPPTRLTGRAGAALIQNYFPQIRFGINVLDAVGVGDRLVSAAVHRARLLCSPAAAVNEHLCTIYSIIIITASNYFKT